MSSIDRRIFLKSSLLCGLALSVGTARGQGQPPAPKRASQAIPGLALERELIALACRAANSHNAQAWLFHAEPGRITLRPDRSRRCAQVDPHDHHLWVSIGCATENIVQAAPGMGKQPLLDIVDGERPEVVVTLLDAPAATAAPLARFIAHRQTTRSDYDGQSVHPAQLRKLEEAAAGRGVGASFLTDRAERSVFEKLILEANAVQTESPEFRRELKQWLRFNEADAKRHGDGLFCACSGNPEAPRWLGELLFDCFYTATRANETLARQLASSSGFILLHSARNDIRQWIEVGRSAQRVALQITALGMKMAFVNQPLEVEAYRPRLLSALGLGGRHPDLLVRYGFAPRMPSSFRRPLAAVVSLAAMAEPPINGAMKTL